MIVDNIRDIVSFEDARYNTTEFKRVRGLESFNYLKPKEFKKYRDKMSPTIAGDIFISQRKYKDILRSKNPEGFEKNKRRRDIIGICRVHLDERYNHSFGSEDLFFEPYKKYDLYASSSFRNCIGYAQVAPNSFVRLVRHNSLLIYFTPWAEH